MSDDRLDEERGGWLTLMEAKDAEIARLNDVVGRMDREHEMLLDRLQDAEGEMREEIAHLTAELRRVREVTDRINRDALRQWAETLGERDEAIALLRDREGSKSESVVWQRRVDDFLARVGEKGVITRSSTLTGRAAVQTDFTARVGEEPK